MMLFDNLVNMITITRKFFWYLSLGFFLLLFISCLTVCGHEKAVQSSTSSKISDTIKIKHWLDSAAVIIRINISSKSTENRALTYIDSALMLSDLCNLTNWKYESLLLKGTFYYNYGEPEQGKVFFMQVVNHYQQTQDKLRLVKAWTTYGHHIIQHGTGDFQLKIYCFQQAQKLFVSLHNRLSEIECSKNIADAHLNLGKLDLAEIELLQVVADLKQIHYRHLQYTYDLLGSVAKLKNDTRKYLYYRIEVVKAMEASNDFTYASFYYAKLGVFYGEMNMLQKANYYYNKALKVSKPGIDIYYYPISTALAKNLIAQQLWQPAIEILNKISSAVNLTHNAYDLINVYRCYAICYSGLKQTEKAKEYYLKAIEAADYNYKLHLISIDNYLQTYVVVDNYYIDTKQFAKVASHINQLLQLPKSAVGPLVLKDLELDAFKIDSVSGNYQSAINHYKRYTILKDSVLNNAKLKQIDELQYKFETEKKDKDLQLKDKNIQLLKKQTLLQNIKAERNRNQRNYIVAGAFVLLLLLVYVYYRYQAKQRGNLLLQQKQIEITEKNTALERLLKENEWLLIEVHHRVKNNLQTVTGLLSSQSVYLKDKVALDAINESQHRVQSMALIHQKLYKTNNFSSIYMPDYLLDLLDYLKDSYNTYNLIYFDVDIEPMFLDVSYTVPLGLIVNEIITNAIKYAFSTGDNNRISIKLYEKDSKIILVAKDNGNGLPQNFDSNQNSFGMLLMNGLTEEMGGEFRIFTDQGTIVQVCFEPVIQPTRKAG
jgi:two-component sensor histidine kinase